MGQLMAIDRTVQLGIIARCLLWRGLKCHCPMYNVPCIFFNKCLYFSYYMAEYFLNRPCILMEACYETRYGINSITSPKFPCSPFLVKSHCPGISQLPIFFLLAPVFMPWLLFTAKVMTSPSFRLPIYIICRWGQCSFSLTGVYIRIVNIYRV